MYPAVYLCVRDTGMNMTFLNDICLKSSKIDMRSNKDKCRILGSYRKVV